MNNNHDKTIPLRTAVVGVGSMGHAHCKTIVEQIPEMRLTAVVSASEKRSQQVGAEFNVPSFTDVDALIAADLADVVIVATPHPAHHHAVEACLKAGCHVICEKPLSDDVATADSMLAAAKEANRAMGIVFQLRYGDLYNTAREFIDSGQLGKMLRTMLILPDFRAQSYYMANQWRGTWEGEGGGVLLNQASHLMDLFLLLTGLPSSLVGHANTSEMHDIEVEDQAEALLSYENGATGYFYTSTTEPNCLMMFEIVGTKGSLTYRDGELVARSFGDDLIQTSHTSDSVWARPDVTVVDRKKFAPGSEAPLISKLIKNFARHILHGETLICDAESALMSLEMANAITLSSHLNTPVKMPIDRKAFHELLSLRKRHSKPKVGVAEVSHATDPTVM